MDTICLILPVSVPGTCLTSGSTTGLIATFFDLNIIQLLVVVGTVFTKLNEIEQSIHCRTSGSLY